MGYIEFGNTWWGAKWLDALSGTDYENRLPRGKRYARNGSVKKVGISGLKISADVQGSRPRPYKVSISLPKFTAANRKAALDAVTDNPAFLSQLLNRQLPPSLFDEFQQRSVPLFPKTWNDFSALCSCPDWAFCCKHIAAVIYLIANEVDKNPFLLFKLHDFDIFAALAKAGFEVDAHRAVAIPATNDFILNSAPVEDGVQSREDRDKLLSELDFSAIPELRDDVMSLLGKRPLFYLQKDFKQVLDKAFGRTARKAKAEIMRLTDIRNEDDGEVAATVYSDAEIVVSNDLALVDLTLESGDDDFSTEDGDDLFLLLALLCVVPQKQIHSHHNRIISLSLLTQFALRLIEKGAMIPEILTTGKGSRIRWVPALINAQVRRSFEIICDLSPGDLVEEPFLARSEQVKTVLAEVLARYIELFCENSADLRGDDILDMFFTGAILPNAKKFQDQEVAESIALWLSRFHIARKDFVPVVKVDEVDDGFALELLAENRTAKMPELVPLKKILNLKKYQTVKYDILKDTSLLAEWIPEISDCLATEGKARPVFSPQEFETVLFRQLPVLRLLDIPILLPKGLDRLLRPRLSASVSMTGSETARSYLSLDDMLRFNWQVAIGDTLISVEEFRKLARSYRGIVKLKDEFVYLDEKEIGKLLRELEAEPRLSAKETFKTVLSGEFNGVALQLDGEVRALISEMLRADPLEVPGTLNAKLRDYQHRGYEWLAKNARLGFGSLIADDMGLGKTIQILTLLLHWRDEGRLSKQPALIVVPTSLLTNWKRETETFAPDLRVHIYHGGKRDFVVDQVDVFFTSYGLLRRDGAVFSKQNWAAVIIDEAQGIKNARTAQTRAIKALKTGLRVAMTGTPVENRLSEYWSIFDFLNKGYLKGQKAFRDDFALPIEIDRDQRQLDLFRRITAPFILRRLKSDKSIIKDLPEKIEIDQYCQLASKQAALYQAITEQIMRSIENAADIERRGLVLKLITALKQICNHPTHFLKKGALEADLSGKTALLLELLRAMHETEEKVLLFTQYAEMGVLLQKLLAAEFHAKPLFLHGGLSRANRDRMVDNFQQKPHVRILILSLKAGGTGLNLTAAQNVIHFDLWWNPAVEAQATDRAYRIGQTKNVMVHRMITRGTFEEKINDMLKYKRELADLTVAAGEKWIGDYSNKDLRQIFSLH